MDLRLVDSTALVWNPVAEFNGFDEYSDLYQQVISAGLLKPKYAFGPD
jgi:hypothetical protein